MADGTATLEVADSRFLAFVRPAASSQDAASLQAELKSRFPDAAHVPIGWLCSLDSGSRDVMRWSDDDGDKRTSMGQWLRVTVGLMWAKRRSKAGFRREVALQCLRLLLLALECSFWWRLVGQSRWVPVWCSLLLRSYHWRLAPLADLPVESALSS